MANDNPSSAATAVNSQITDAVTQTNVKVVAEAPAHAMATVYQSLAHSVGLLFENAVATQQQQNILAQAATTQGIMQIYSLDTIATATGVAKEDGVLGPTQSAAAALKAALPPAAAVTSAGGISSQIEQAVKLALDSTLQHSGDVAYGVRAAAGALAAALESTNRASQQNLLEMIKNAATTACLTAMIALPDKAAAYEDILDTIRKLR
ncbi:MAG: RebB family R body protein [Xanthomonadaceae bacterium]|nr:RebB family R body protein [Xanthomonadaceae bacterium]